MGETTRQPPPSDSTPSLNVVWEPGTSFPSGATFVFTWSNTSVNTDDWYIVTPILFYGDSNMKNTTNKIKQWADVAVSTHMYLLTLPQIDDQEKRMVYMELWCSNRDKLKATKALCGKSPQFTLQPHNNYKPAPSPASSFSLSFSSSITKASTTAPTTAAPTTTTPKPTTTVNGKNSTTLNTFPTGSIIPSINATTSIITSATITNTQKHTTSLTPIVATQMPPNPSQPLPPQDKEEDKNHKKTKAPPAATLTAECKENIPNPSCLPIIPSFIAPSSSSSATASLSNPGNATSDKSESYAGSRIDGGVISVIVIVCAMVLTLGLYSLHIRRQRIGGPFDEDGRQRLRGGGGGGGECGGDDGDPETGSMRSSTSSVRKCGRTRADRIIPPWSMSFIPADSNENGQPQVPPVHISHTALIEDPARKQRWQRQQQAQSPRQRAAALHAPSHSHSEGNGGGSNPMSPVSTEFSSRYRGAVSKSPRYPVTAPGGVVLTTAQAAHAMHSHVPLPPMSSELSSSTTSDRPETPPIRVWSPLGRRRLTDASARSTSSRASSIFSELSDFTSGSSSWTEKDNTDDCSGPLRQGYEIRPVEFPKPAALRRTHISPPIRSIMSVSNEEGDILGRQDIFIRIEEDEQDRSSDDDENSDYTSDRNDRRYEQQESEYHYKTMSPCSNQSRYRGSGDSYFSRQNSHNHHLPNQLHSSTSTLSRQGHHHHHRYHQHQQSLYNSRRSSMIQTGLCPSIVPPPIPRIPQEYISSEDSSLSRGSSVLSSSLSSSPPIGYDPEWVDTVGEKDEYHDDDDGGVYITHEANWRRKSSIGRRVSRGTGRKGNEVSKPMSKSLMKAVRHERGWSRVSPALSVTQASEWALSRDLERVASNSSIGGGGGVGGSSVEEVGGGYHDERQQQRHVGMEYY